MPSCTVQVCRATQAELLGVFCGGRPNRMPRGAFELRNARISQATLSPPILVTSTASPKLWLPRLHLCTCVSLRAAAGFVRVAAWSQARSSGLFDSDLITGSPQSVTPNPFAEASIDSTADVSTASVNERTGPGGAEPNMSTKDTGAFSVNLSTRIPHRPALRNES